MLYSCTLFHEEITSHGPRPSSRKSWNVSKKWQRLLRDLLQGHPTIGYDINELAGKSIGTHGFGHGFCHHKKRGFLQLVPSSTPGMKINCQNLPVRI